MRITKVELENIKSYRHASILLRHGTTAVRGHNGAGKSTLVEAIGYALFDALNYDQAQFVREGERSGTVTVHFVSALDDREYQVVRRCGSGALWYIYDADLDQRVVEQKADVTDFLRKHMRLETEIALKDLFNDALGVPQGTFTADFLLTPTNRKKKFDALLQVEEYRKAADKLNDTKNYLLDEKRRVDNAIAALERETGQLDGWRTRLVEGRELERTLTSRLETLLQDTEAIEARREQLRLAQQELNRLGGEAQVAAAAHHAAINRHAEAEGQLSEAQAAQHTLQETRTAHDAHLAAQAELVAVRARVEARDRWRLQRAEVAQQLTAVTISLDHTRSRLEAARAAEQRIVALVPQAERQHELERVRDEARTGSQQLAQARQTLARAERETEKLARDIAESERIVAELEALRPEAALLEERRETVAMYQDLRARRTERERRLAKLVQERPRLEQSLERERQAEAKAAENVRKLHASRETAERLPMLESAYAAIEDEMLRLGTQREHHRLSREQSAGGACPFLREPCLNIRQRGANSLETYFDRLIEQVDVELAPLQARLADAKVELDHVRTIRSYYDRLPQYEEQHRQAEQRVGEVSEQLSKVDEEYAEITDWLRDLPGEEKLSQAQIDFKLSDDADKRLREVAPRRAELQRTLARRTDLETELSAQRQAIAGLEDMPERLRMAEEQLAALGDPRAQIAAAQATAKERHALETTEAKLTTEAGTLQRHADEVDEELRPYASVDAEQRAIEEQLARTRPAHTRYLQHEHLAARLPEREVAVAATVAELAAATITRDNAAAAYADAQRSFDPAELEEVRRQADTLRAERGTLAERLRRAQEDSAELTCEIARVEALLDDLSASRQERATLDDLERMLQQFRDTIKEAGPNVTKALLRQISTEANRIFGEVLGDRSAQLSWESDYEIVLRRDGKERTFAQLSGGEQMSAALAMRLALLRRLTGLDIAFFDEPTQNMDDERRGNLAEQIRRVRGFDQLIVISHDDTFEQGLDNVIHLEKQGGTTVLVEEDALVTA